MRRLWLACALAIAAVLRSYSIANAHVRLVSSEPAANSHVDVSPSRLRLELSETVDAKAARITLVGPDGASTSLDVTGDPSNPHALLAAVNGVLSSGGYRVSWYIVSADGHPASGSFSFHLGEGAVAAPPEVAPQPEARPWGPTLGGAPSIPAMLRGLGVGSLAAATGLLFFVVMMGASMDDRPARLALWMSLSAVVLLSAHFVTWLVNTAPSHQITADWLMSAFGATAGRLELGRTLLTLLPLWALALTRRPGLALLFSLPPLLASAAVGHSAAFRPSVSIPLKALHLAALAAWLGGVLWLVVRERDDILRLRREASQVSSIAMTGIVAITLSGVAQAYVMVSSLEAMRSAYGTIILLKIAGLGVLAAFGAHHRFRVMPRLADDDSPLGLHFIASLKREVAVLWLVVVLGGFLAYTPPPAPPPALPPAHHSSASESTS